MSTKHILTKSPLRISTLTMTADWGSPINLDLLFDQLPAHFIPIWYPGEGILKFEHKTNVYGASHKDLFTNRKVTTKSFFNQSTLVIRRPWKDDGWKEMNMKVFANGGVQMTGLPDQEFAIKSLQWMLDIIKSLPKNPFAKEPSLQKICTYLINTDYSLNCEINQDALQSILVDRYNLFSMFEKTIYQGVNAKFFYNTEKGRTPGICSCTKPCTGKGIGEGDGECKRITLSIFRTGSIIITGGRTMEQIEAAYEYINNIFEKHATEVLVWTDRS